MKPGEARQPIREMEYAGLELTYNSKEEVNLSFRLHESIIRIIAGFRVQCFEVPKVQFRIEEEKVSGKINIDHFFDKVYLIRPNRDISHPIAKIFNRSTFNSVVVAYLNKHYEIFPSKSEITDYFYRVKRTAVIEHFKAIAKMSNDFMYSYEALEIWNNSYVEEIMET